MRRIATHFLVLAALCSSAFAGSTINPNVPAQNAPLSSAPVRGNFAATYTDINNILGGFAGPSAPGSPTNLQTWVNTTAAPIYVFSYWNANTSTWVAYGNLNINTNVWTSVVSPGTFAATHPLTVNVSGGVVTYAISYDSNFTNNGSNQLALATVVNGHLIANCSGSSGEPGNCSWTLFADQVVGSTNGMLPYRTGGSWGSISTGTSGGTIPLNNTANIFSAAQSIVLNSTSLPASDTGTLLALGNIDGVATRIELTAAGSNPVITGRSALGTLNSPLTLTSGTLMMSFNAHGYDGTSWTTTANGAFRIYAEGTWSNTSHPTETCMSTTPSASTTISDVFCIHQSGGATLGGTSNQGSGTLNLLGSLYSNGTAPTGTGAYVRATSPSLTTPSIDAATGVSLALGTPGSVVGSISYANGTSGTITIQPTTGALGSSILTLPAITDILAGFSLANGGTNNSLTASNGGIVYSDASKLQILAGTASANQCLLSGSNVAPSWGSCATATVGSVSNSDGTLTISPTTGSVVASLALGHANTWTAVQTFTNSDIALLGSSTGKTTFTSANAGASNFTITVPAVTDTIATLGTADQTLSGGANVTPASLGTKSSGTTTIDCGTSPLQYLTDGGAFTLAAPTNDSSCIVQVINNGSAGAITLSGFSPQPTGTGDSFTTANTASGTATFSNGSANITYTTTLAVGNLIYFTTSGGLPTNFAINTMYYVVSNSGTVITVSATAGGSAIVAGSAGSGTQTAHVPSVFDLSIVRINASAIASWKQQQ